MTARRIVVISAGISDPSSTRLLADRLTKAVIGELRSRGTEAEARVFELRDRAHDIVNAMLTGFAPPPLAEVMEHVAAADAVIAVTPIFSTSYSGLFKSFVDVLDRDALEGTPVLLGATAGTPRHSLAIDYAIRPLFTYLHAEPVSTGVFAASDDWGQGADTVAPLQKRIDRAARELADAVAGRSGAGAGAEEPAGAAGSEDDRSIPAPAARRADPFHPDTYLGEGNDFTSLLNGLSR